MDLSDATRRSEGPDLPVSHDGSTANISTAARSRVTIVFSAITQICKVAFGAGHRQKFFLDIPNSEHAWEIGLLAQSSNRYMRLP